MVVTLSLPEEIINKLFLSSESVKWRSGNRKSVKSVFYSQMCFVAIVECKNDTDEWVHK